MDLQVSERTALGRKVRQLRNEGMIPAELYGHGIANMHLAVGKNDFVNIYKKAGESSIINLVIGKERCPVLIQSVQLDPNTSMFSHVDFYQVRMDEVIRAEVPIVFIGESAAVKSLGGILVRTLQGLPVESLPGDLPHEIEVDISRLAELDSALYVKDITLPKGVKAMIAEGTAVVSVAAPKAEEEVAAPEVTVDSVKVESEEKKEQRDAAKNAKAEAE